MKIYIGNLSKDMTDAQLKDLFTPFGTTTSANIAKDRDTGASRGFGFVEMSDAQAKAAIAALHGKEVGGRVLKVNESQPKGAPRPA